MARRVLDDQLARAATRLLDVESQRGAQVQCRLEQTSFGESDCERNHRNTSTVPSANQTSSAPRVRAKASSSSRVRATRLNSTRPPRARAPWIRFAISGSALNSEMI